MKKYYILILLVILAANCKGLKAPDGLTKKNPDNTIAKPGNEISGTVVSIADGDSFTIVDQTDQRLVIRLQGIDAPEKDQISGKDAKRALERMISKQDIVVLVDKKDQFKRFVGIAKIGETDVGLEMIKQGYAWHFKRYQKEQSKANRDLYANAEITARSNQLGLWRDPDPTPPWEFRKSKQSR